MAIVANTLYEKAEAEAISPLFKSSKLWDAKHKMGIELSMLKVGRQKFLLGSDMIEFLEAIGDRQGAKSSAEKQGGGMVKMAAQQSGINAFGASRN